MSTVRQNFAQASFGKDTWCLAEQVVSLSHDHNVTQNGVNSWATAALLVLPKAAL